MTLASIYFSSVRLLPMKVGQRASENFAGNVKIVSAGQIKRGRLSLDLTRL